MLTRIIPPRLRTGETAREIHGRAARRHQLRHARTSSRRSPGRARYAEDFRADGMLFCKLMLSERPHARVRAHRHQPRDALARRARDPHRRTTCRSLAAPTEHCLTNEPLYAGEPILAVAAVERGDRRRGDRADSARSRAAAPRHRSDREPAARRPERAHRRQRLGPARRSGHSRRARPIQELKWTEADFADGADGRCRWARRPRNGRSAISTPASRTPRWCSTNRSSCRPPAIIRWKRAARWRSGRTASCICTAPRRASCARWTRVARWVGIEPKDVVLICEYTGGGFGSKGGGAVSMAIPGAALEEGQRAGDDAHQPRGRKLHRPRAHQHGRPRQGRLRERRHASSRSICSSSRTTVRTDRWAITDRPATPRR